MKNYIVIKFTYGSAYEGYIYGYIHEYYSRQIAVVEIIQNKSTMPCEEGSTTLLHIKIRCNTYLFEKEESAERKMKELEKNE